MGSRAGGRSVDHRGPVSLYFRVMELDVLSCRADVFDIALGIFWRGIWARGTTSQKCGKNAKRYHFLSWYLCIYTGVNRFVSKPDHPEG